MAAMTIGRLGRTLILGLGIWWSSTTSAEAYNFRIYSDRLIANTFDAVGTASWRQEDSVERAEDRDMRSRFNGAIRRYASNQTNCGNGKTCSMASWHEFLASVRDDSTAEKLDAVNRWVNRFPYVSDWDNWNVADYWESPAELIAHGGDCEDYAVTKYLALRELGFDPAAMRIVIVRDGFEDHAVLVVRNKGHVYLLDNLHANVVDGASARDYRLIYAVNEQHFWRYRNLEIPTPGIQTASRNATSVSASPALPDDTNPPLIPDVATPAPTRIAVIAGVKPITTREIEAVAQGTAVVTPTAETEVATMPTSLTVAAAPAATADTEQQASLP